MARNCNCHSHVAASRSAQQPQDLSAPGTGVSRRGFLLGLGALGAGAMLPDSAFFAQAPGNGANPRMIDVHHHILPPAYLSEVRDRFIAQQQGFLPPTLMGWTPQNSIAEMDQNGVAAAVISISTPGVWFGNPQAGRTLARKCNEYAAQMARDYPRRFGFFAAVPLPDREGSLQEIAYALDVLKADGIGLITSYGDKWVGDPAYAEVLNELNRRKAVVYVHPTAANCCRDLIPYVPNAITEYPEDTTRAVTSLLFSGSLTRLRDVCFIFAHAGGTLPMLAGRISRAAAGRKELAEKVPNGVEYELKRLHYDIANSANRPAMAALMALVPTSQIVFGSDYPFQRIQPTAGGLTSLGLSAADLEAIGRNNAAALFPRFNKP
jgi:6-methylsalicylate decarboxylase